MPFRVIVVGSGQDGGVPQMGFDRPSGPERSAASIVVVDDAGGAVLFDASPDLRSQQRLLLDVHAAYAARRLRDPFDAVFLTHGHMGHYVGLVQFGKEAADTRGVPLAVTPAMAKYLMGNDPWASIIGEGHLAVVPLTSGGAEPLPGLVVEPVPVPHRAENTDTVGFSISTAQARLLYLPDIDGWSEWPAARAVMSNHDLLIVDGTFSDSGEILPRRISDVPHPLMADTMERFVDLAPRVVFTHLNRTNPASDPMSPEAERVRAAGFRIAHDGLVLPL